MTIRKQAAALAVLLGGLCGAETYAQCTIVFSETFNNYWQNANNWFPRRLPESTDIACIPAGQSAQVSGNQCTVSGYPCNGHVECGEEEMCQFFDGGEAGAIIVDGFLNIFSGAYLRLHGYYTCTGGSQAGAECDPGGDPGTECPGGTCNETPSQINNELLGNWGGILYVDRDLTIVGNWGRLQAWYLEQCAGLQSIMDVAGVCSGGENDGRVCPPCGLTPPCRTVACADACPGGECVPPSPMPRLTIRGAGGNIAALEMRGSWKVCVPLQNDATVIADELNNDMLLEVDGIGGSGLWKVQHDSNWGTGDGTLVVNGTVTGSATWEVQDLGVLTFNAPCTSLTGDVHLHTKQPALRINADFATSGNLNYQVGSIRVSAGNTACFDVD